MLGGLLGLWVAGGVRRHFISQPALVMVLARVVLVADDEQFCGEGCGAHTHVYCERRVWGADWCGGVIGFHMCGFGVAEHLF